jgi:hypothetical protein
MKTSSKQHTSRYTVPSFTLLVLSAILIIAHALPTYAEDLIASGRAMPPASLSYDTELLKTIKKPQTVVDYFLLLPEAYFTHYGATTSSVKSFGTRTRRTILSSFSSDTSKMLGVELFTGALEIKNKYLIINTPENSEGYSFSVALWTLKNKKTLVGFCRRRWQREGVGTEVAFLTFENNKWQDVTAQVFPDIPLTTFFSWSGLKKYPHIKAPLDMELARSEQAITVHLDMLTLQQMPELKPIGAAGLEKSVTIRTLELRLNNDAFAIVNKY